MKTIIFRLISGCKEKTFAMYVIAGTEYGEVRGVRKTSALDVEYISFYSIPYGTPPLGELRFKVSCMFD